MRWRRLSIFLVAAGLAAAELAVAQPTNEQIANAIENLSAREFDTRNAATELLWQAGEAAEAALEQAAKSDDPEVRTRAASVLKKLRLGIRPDTPADVLLLIDQFRYAESPEQRRLALNELQAKERWQTVLALIRGEQNPQERRNLATAIAGQTGKIVGALVEKGNYSHAEEVLELVASTETGLPQLTAFLLLTDRIGQQVAVARQRANEQSTSEVWARLAYLLRAQGDLPGAIEAAANIDDLVLGINLLAEAGRWSEAAPLAEKFYQRHASRLEGLAFATTFYRLSNQVADHSRTLDALRKAANMERLNELTATDRPADPFGPSTNLAMSQFVTVAKTLFVNERIDEALAIMRKINPLVAYNVYVQQHRHREALEFVHVTPDKVLDRAWLDALPAPPQVLSTNVDPRIVLAAQVARHLRELGRTEQVEQIWRILRDSKSLGVIRGSWPLVLTLFATQLGRQDDADRLGAEALREGIAPTNVFAVLARQEGPLAAAWYDRLTAADPQIDRAKAIRTAISLVAANSRRGGPPENWRTIVTQAHEAVQNLGAKEKAERLVLFGQTCKIRGDSELAKAMFAEAAQLFPANSIHLGDICAAEGDWQGAAKHYAATVRANPADSSARYHLADALAKNGDEDGAIKERLQANLLVLAPESRLGLAASLASAGQKPDAAKQYELVCRTALPDSPIATNASREIGKLIDANEPRRAALYWEQILLHALNTTAPFTEAEGFPLLATQVIHKARAQAAIAEGNAATVGAELSSCEKILPADVRLTVELIPELRRAGMTEQADGLFERALVLHRQVIQEHPMSATYLNNAAWICGRGQRGLDEGLEFALKAVELMPHEAAYQDTLAEIYFQRGEREQAVAAATKCLEIAPANKMFATRLAHFRNDELKTLDKDPE